MGTEAASWLVLRANVHQPLAAGDRMDVHVDAGGRDTLASIVTDPAAIARVRAFVDARTGGWQKSWHTPPLDRVHVILYEGDQVRGWFASGDGFLQAPAPDGRAAMRRARGTELEELNRLLGLPPKSHLGLRR
jgi:hypothetical protein